MGERSRPLLMRATTPSPIHPVTRAKCQGAKRKLKVGGREVVETQNRLTCFTPNNYLYPLCVGNGSEKCKTCNLNEDMESEDAD